MKQVSNEEQLDFFAEMLEPAAEIFADEEIARTYRSGRAIQAVTMAIKNHKSAAIAILAALNCEDVKTYKVPGPLALFSQLLDLANSDEVQNLFSSQAPTSDAASSGPATEITKDGAV